MLPPVKRRSRATGGLLAATVVLVASALSSCATAPEESAPRAEPTVTEPAPSYQHYVALGDSYTAAPLFFEVKKEVTGCLRSKDNYPNLISDALGVELDDVSCSGATTADMLTRQHFTEGSQPAQFDALTPATDLVTVGIGANDFEYFTGMMNTCMELAVGDADGDPCRRHNTTSQGVDRLERKLRDIELRVSAVVDGIRQRSPEARVMMVGYPVLIPEDGVCRGRLPLAVGDYSYARELNVSLSGAVRDAAQQAGAEYIDLVKASEGHDICSDDPWVAGVAGAPGALGLHPFPTEQRAVADLALELLDPSSTTADTAEG